MSPTSLLLPTPDRRRRDWLAMACLAAMPLTALTQPAGGASLPAAQSLPDELARALKNRQPLIVMASLDGCVFCRQARQSHLSPMHKAGTVIVQVDLRSKQQVLDFAGQLTTHDQLTRQWKITITPTLLFFGPGGKEVAERMEGAYLPDFYGPYLEERLATGRKSL
jgi:thioredoxin-related protein